MELLNKTWDFLTFSVFWETKSSHLRIPEKIRRKRGEARFPLNFLGNSYDRKGLSIDDVRISRSTSTYVGPTSGFCCSSAPQTPLTAGVRDGQTDIIKVLWALEA